MEIDFGKLQYQYQLYKEEIDKSIQNVLSKSNYIMGEEIEALEASLETFTGSKYAVSCSSGTDALLLAMMALDIKAGDEIITTPFSFISTAETIACMGAVPVFVDIDERTFNIDPLKIEQKITSKTKAIIPVSLYGQPSDMTSIQKIADQHSLKVIVDGAQSFGSTYKGKTDSTLGDISATSFYPAKPLGCYGDGGAVFTNDEEIAHKMKYMRVHGQTARYYHKYIGMGGRLDTIQAAILNVKLKYFEQDLSRRQQAALNYTKALANKDLILPFIHPDTTSSWAQYSIRVKDRDGLQDQLRSKGVPTAVHYPLPLHLQECFKYLSYKNEDMPISEQASKEILCLPMNPYLDDKEIEYIASVI